MGKAGKAASTALFKKKQRPERSYISVQLALAEGSAGKLCFPAGLCCTSRDGVDTASFSSLFKERLNSY